MFSDADIERILGWNDGTRIGIRSEALASPMVQCHEGIHGRIFHETVDGHLHRLCCLAAGSAEDRRHSDVFTIAAKALFADTRLAHEAGATYLGIQGLPDIQMHDALSGLTPEYRLYYNYLAEIIDPIVEGSWLRFAFAWTLIHWCFHSPRARRFFHDVVPDIAVILDVDGPDDRLAFVRAWFAKSGRAREWVESSLSAACSEFERRGFTCWDLESDEAWEKREHFDCQVLESEITAHAGDWLLDNVPIETDDFRTADPQLGVGFDHLLMQLRMTPMHLKTERGSILDEQYRSKDLERQALVHASDIVDHKPTVRLRQVEPGAIASLLPSLLASTDIIVLSADDQDHLIVLGRSKENSDPSNHQYFEHVSAIVARDEFIELLRLNFLPEETGNEIPRVWAMVRTNRQEILQGINVVLQLFAFPEGDSVKLGVPTERIIFYFDGPWTDIYDMPGVQVASYPLGLIDSPKSEEHKPLSIRIAESPNSPAGLIISAKPSWSGYRLDEYEKSRFNAGTLTKSITPREKIVNSLTPFFSAWHVWSRF